MKNSENDKAFKPQSYLRLLKFTAPYWKRLTFGIICGMLVGSSLFFALMLLPQLVGLVDSGSNLGVSVKQHHVGNGEMQKLRNIAGDPKLGEEEKQAQIRQILTRSQSDETDPKLRQLLTSARGM